MIITTITKIITYLTFAISGFAIVHFFDEPMAVFFYVTGSLGLTFFLVSMMFEEK